MRRPNCFLGFAVGGASLAAVGPAHAAVPRCDDVRVQIAGELPARWVSPIEHACAELAAAPGTDQTARVRIESIDADGELSIEVVLADGRSAKRRIRSPAALQPTLEALLIVPPQRPRVAPPATSEAEHAPRTETTWPRTQDMEPSPPARTQNEPNVGVELGGSLGGRVAARGYLSLAFDAFGEIRVGSWLLGTLFRWDFLGQKSAPLVQVFELETVGAGLLVARRLALGFGALDVGITPRLAVETQTYENATGEQSISTTDVRLGAFTRLAFGSAALRVLVELDGELSPSRLRRTVQLDPLLPALPAWSAGLSAGVMWAAP